MEKWKLGLKIYFRLFQFYPSAACFPVLLPPAALDPVPHRERPERSDTLSSSVSLTLQRAHSFSAPVQLDPHPEPTSPPAGSCRWPKEASMQNPWFNPKPPWAACPFPLLPLAVRCPGNWCVADKRWILNPPAPLFLSLWNGDNSGVSWETLIGAPRKGEECQPLLLTLLTAFSLNLRVQDVTHLKQEKANTLFFSFWSHLRCHGCSPLRTNPLFSLVQLIFSPNATHSSNKTLSLQI